MEFSMNELSPKSLTKSKLITITNIGGRRLYQNIYHPSFGTVKHFK